MREIMLLLPNKTSSRDALSTWKTSTLDGAFGADCVKMRLCMSELSLYLIISWHYTGYTQKNGAFSLYSPLKPHYSFVYTLYIGELLENLLFLEMFG
jgi:hypothetical protein